MNLAGHGPKSVGVESMFVGKDLNETKWHWTYQYNQLSWNPQDDNVIKNWQK